MHLFTRNQIRSSVRKLDEKMQALLVGTLISGADDNRLLDLSTSLALVLLLAYNR